MGNCANKPLTNEEGEAVPVEKPVDATAVETVEREIKVDDNKVTASTDAPRSLAEVLEEEGKKAEIKEDATKPVEEKPSLPAKPDTEPKKEEAPKATAEPTKPVSSTEPAKPVSLTEPAKPAISEPKKEEIKPAEVPTVVKKVEETKPAGSK